MGDWFHNQLKLIWEVDFKARLGPDPFDDKCVRLLNRVIEWNRDGIHIEGDQRHAEIIVREMSPYGLPNTTNPGERINPKNLSDSDRDLVSAGKASLYRRNVAIANYLSQDRSDIRFVVKELSRRMSAPRECDFRGLLRLAKYLSCYPRVIHHFPYQRNFKIIDIWSDSDHAGCLETRKSTSGGIVMFGSHCIKHWSTTQSVISISSGEAEYYACVKAGSTGLGIVHLIGDFDVKKRLRIKTDASVAKSLASRRGVGGIRHIEVNQLWLQEKVNNGIIEIERVKGTSNVADALTKFHDTVTLRDHLAASSQEHVIGRHKIAPDLATHESFDDIHNS